MKTLLKVLAIAVLCSLGGCASTRFQTPFGTYAGEKDVDIEGLEFEKKADGSVTFKAAKLTSTASTVNQITADAVLEAVRRIPLPK